MDHGKLHGQVLWIDEAGLLSTHDMKRVFDLAKELQFRVVLSGDSAQHSAVARGDALRLLQDEAGMKFAQLTSIRRQTQQDYREAVQAIAAGDSLAPDGRSQLESGIERLDRMGAIVEASGEARHRQLAADYAMATAEQTQGGKPKTALVVSPTHSEGRQVAAAIRDELKRAGRLGKTERVFTSLRALNRTEAERGNAGSYHAGEIIRFHQNAKGFTRGERLTVTAADSRAVQAARADGHTVTLPLGQAQHFSVFRDERLQLATGDRLRITMNGYTQETTKAGKPSKSRLNNGDVYDVAGFTRTGDIRLTNGTVVPKDYGGITQGYVVTSHASQGATVDTVLIALGNESLGAANRQQFYVSVSRGREALRIYTDDKAAMKEAVRSDASRLSATELLQAKPVPSPVRRAAAERLFSLRRVQRSYEAVCDRVRALIGHGWQREAHYVGR